MPLESDLEARCRDLAQELGFRFIKLHPYRRGTPDRLLIGIKRVVFVELKRKGKHATDVQLAAHSELIGLGHAVSVIRDLTGMRNLLRTFDAPHN